MDEAQIHVRMTQCDSRIEWLFNWLGTRWEAQAFDEVTYASGVTEQVAVIGTHTFSNTRRGAIRKAKRRLHNKRHKPDWEVV